MQLPDKVTKEQLDIIHATEGYIRVASVPGSGKTFVLTYRMAYLITELYIDSASIVALTFTNKAAAEMKQRLKKIVGDNCNSFTGTFHGFCNHILKEEIHRMSFPKTVTILDKKAEIDMIREVAEELGISMKDNTARQLMEFVDASKQMLGYVELMMGSGKTALKEKLATVTDANERIFYHYLKRQCDNYALDFEDIINFALYILSHYEDARRIWQERCQYLLCDEYQDVNYKQNELLKILSGLYGNLFVVGDDDQNIYTWRGSDPSFMIGFDEDYEDVQDYALTENFRSTPQVVKAAGSLIKANQNRIDKVMISNRADGGKPVYNCPRTEREEAEWIADVILQDRERNLPYRDHAVLVRAASQTRSLEETFIKKKVPYKILSGAKFYESEEIRTVLAYLRLVYNLRDMDLTYTISRPRRGFGKKSVEQLKQYAGKHGISLFEALGQCIESGEIKKESVITYYQNVKELHETYQQYSCTDIANRCLDMGLRVSLEQDIDQTRLDNVSELVSMIHALEEQNQEILPLEDLLSHFALFTAQDDDTKHDVVRVMTIHTAKGLEFDTVFVPGLVDGQFPSYRLRNEDELEEERRLLYVAMTRAKNMLYLSSYENKDTGYSAKQSVFLGDMDATQLECINGSRIVSSGAGEQMLPKVMFAEGDRVVHKVFGEGTVVTVDRPAQTYDIQFDKLRGTRRIMFRAELEGID